MRRCYSHEGKEAQTARHTVATGHGNPSMLKPMTRASKQPARRTSDLHSPEVAGNLLLRRALDHAETNVPKGIAHNSMSNNPISQQHKPLYRGGMEKGRVLENTKVHVGHDFIQRAALKELITSFKRIS